MNLSHGVLVSAPKVGIIGALQRFLTDPGALLNDKVILILGIIYIVAPIDFLPEAILPIVGFGDDLLVLAKIMRIAAAAKKTYSNAKPVMRAEAR